jgi:hypothetical protein
VTAMMRDIHSCWVGMGRHLRPVFKKFMVWIYDQASTFPCFPPHILPQLGHDDFLPNLFQFIYHLIQP